jgi:hypothetical protein
VLIATTWPGLLLLVYDAGTRVVPGLGGVRVLSAEELRSEQAWKKRELRALFDFDGFIGSSLRSAVDVFAARRHLIATRLEATTTETQLFVIV